MNLAGITGNTQEEIKQSLKEYFDKARIVEIGRRGGKTFTIHRHRIKCWPIIRKMKSKSKQPRYVYVVKRSEV